MGTGCGLSDRTNRGGETNCGEKRGCGERLWGNTGAGRFRLSGNPRDAPVRMRRDVQHHGALLTPFSSWSGGSEEVSPPQLSTPVFLVDFMEGLRRSKDLRRSFVQTSGAVRNAYTLLASRIFYTCM
ncbi:unnamed protein product [Coccothraustes coccothraustes]